MYFQFIKSAAIFYVASAVSSFITIIFPNLPTPLSVNLYGLALGFFLTANLMLVAYLVATSKWFMDIKK